jgi:hypothetical protein
MGVFDIIPLFSLNGAFRIFESNPAPLFLFLSPAPFTR